MMNDNLLIENEVTNDKNKNAVRCKFCNSLMLKEQQGKYVNNEFQLPTMQMKYLKGVKIENETCMDFWCVDDMFNFENIGFSNTVQNRKYLICADCDMGPVGFHDIDNKQCYIALKRVRHGSIN